MKYELFTEELTECIINMAEPGEEVTVRKILKNNDTAFDSVTVKQPGCNMTPTLYFQDLKRSFDEGMEMDELARSVLSYSRTGSGVWPAEDFDPGDYSYFRDKVMFRLVSSGKNRQYLRHRPHRSNLDLEIVYYYQCRIGKESMGTISVGDEDLNRWGISEEDIYRDALRNTPILNPPVICPITDLLNSFLDPEEGTDPHTPVRDTDPEEGANPHTPVRDTDPDESIDPHTPVRDTDPEESTDPHVPVRDTDPDEGDEIEVPVYEPDLYGNTPVPLLVLTNESKYCGAACMLYEGLLRNLSDEIRSDLFIIPSSIHEVLLLPDEGEFSEEELSALVCEINAHFINPSEILSDHVYRFKRLSGILE